MSYFLLWAIAVLLCVVYLDQANQIDALRREMAYKVDRWDVDDFDQELPPDAA